MNSNFKISKRSVDALDLSKDAFYWDSSIPGFGVRVRDGRRTYVIKYGSGRRWKRGQKGTGSRMLTIGEHGMPFRPDENGEGRSLTPDLARQEATRLRGLVADGQDPAIARVEARRMPTLAEFWPRYLRDYAKPHKRESTVENDEWTFSHELAPAFGGRRLDQIDAASIARWHVATRERLVRRDESGEKIGDGAAFANRCLGLLSGTLTAAIRWGLLKSANPCSSVRRFPEPKRDRLLEPGELARIGAVLASSDHGVHLYCRTGILLLLMTGARRSEIARLRWEQIDNAQEVIVDGIAGRVIIQTGKTGKRYIFLPRTILETLSKIPRVNQWVLPARYDPKGRITEDALTHAWAIIAKAAGVTGARLHDIRHLHISTTAKRSGRLTTAAKLAGQATAGVTDGYTHVAPGELLTEAEATAVAIKGWLEAPPQEK